MTREQYHRARRNQATNSTIVAAIAFAIAIVLSMVFSCVAGCGKPPEPTQVIELDGTPVVPVHHLHPNPL